MYLQGRLEWDWKVVCPFLITTWFQLFMCVCVWKWTETTLKRCFCGTLAVDVTADWLYISPSKNKDGMNSQQWYEHDDRTSNVCFQTLLSQHLFEVSTLYNVQVLSARASKSSAALLPSWDWSSLTSAALLAFSVSLSASCSSSSWRCLIASARASEKNL